jgi:hypothetical protein
MFSQYPPDFAIEGWTKVLPLTLDLFANPAVTIARSLTDALTGIAPAGVLAFIAHHQGAVRTTKWTAPR